jgi:hypothetical protein
LVYGIFIWICMLLDRQRWLGLDSVGGQSASLATHARTHADFHDSRLLREKESLRDDLRARAPQATNLPEPVDEEDEDGSNSDFDESEDDDTDDDESDDDEQSQPQPQPPPPDITEGPPPVTLTHAPEPTSNPSDEPSDIPPPSPPADESSSATDLSSTLIPTTTTFASLPSDTALSSETENLDTIQGSSSALTGTDSAVPTVDPDSGSDDVSDGGSPDRAKDIGIILGTLGKLQISLAISSCQLPY